MDSLAKEIGDLQVQCNDLQSKIENMKKANTTSKQLAGNLQNIYHPTQKLFETL